MNISNLKERREKLNLTQWELAKKVGVSPGSIRKWENGVVKPSDKNKETLKSVLGNDEN